jgi:hypothetical protein
MVGDVKAPFSCGPFATSLIDMNSALETIVTVMQIQSSGSKGSEI